MMPSWFLSAYVYGCAKKPLTDRPSESRVIPVPMVGFGFPFASRPSDRILLVLWDPPSVSSQEKLGLSTSVVVIWSSRPVFCTEPRFRVIVRLVVPGTPGAPADAAIGCAMSASFV